MRNYDVGVSRQERAKKEDKEVVVWCVGWRGRTDGHREGERDDESRQGAHERGLGYLLLGSFVGPSLGKAQGGMCRDRKIGGCGLWAVPPLPLRRARTPTAVNPSIVIINNQAQMPRGSPKGSILRRQERLSQCQYHGTQVEVGAALLGSQ